MVARYSGASLGLFAFAVAVVAGLAAGNPFAVTLSRSILALFLFCLIGLVLGQVAQWVVLEHQRTREKEIRARYQRLAQRPAREAETDQVMQDLGASTHA